MEWPGLLALAALWVGAELSKRVDDQAARLLVVATATLAVALAIHVVPGFNNPMVATDIRLSPNSAPMRQATANFDKGAAGLILLAYYCRRVQRAADWPSVIGVGLAAGAVTSVVVIGAVALSGVVQPDLKLPRFALLWVPINLLLTCVLEEAFFRGLLQERMTTALAHRDHWRWLPLPLCSLLFGLAHAGGGPALIAAATLAGVGYGAAYAITRRIESAIVAHFSLNAIHFFAFTYPYAVGR
jgi:membrane protease YdiL (CAAX protease family)